MGRLCGERGTAQALRASAGRKKRVSPHPAPKHPEAPRSAPNHPKAPRAPAPAAAGASPLPPPAPWVRARPAPSPSLPRIYPRIYVPRPGRFGCPAARVRSCRSRRVPAPAACAVGAHQPRTARVRRTQETRLAAPGSEEPQTTPKCHTPAAASPRQPQPATSSRPPPTPHLRRPFRAYILGYTSLSPTGSDAPPRVPAPAAAGAPPRQPQPATSSRPPRTFAAPSPSLPRIYPRIYVPLPGRFGCPAARVRSCRGRRVPPSRPPKGARGKRPPPPPEKLS